MTWILLIACIALAIHCWRTQDQLRESEAELASQRVYTDLGDKEIARQTRVICETQDELIKERLEVIRLQGKCEAWDRLTAQSAAQIDFLKRAKRQLAASFDESQRERSRLAHRNMTLANDVDKLNVDKAELAQAFGTLLEEARHVARTFHACTGIIINNNIRVRHLRKAVEAIEKTIGADK